MVPLGATHHRALHGVGESDGGRERGINPVNLAQRLWYETRDGSAMEAWEPEGVAIKETICLAQS